MSTTSYQEPKSLEQPFLDELRDDLFPSIMTRDLVLPSQTNSHGTLFGGQALRIMDKAAAIMAIEHSEEDVVTASAGHEGAVEFRAPIRESDIIEVEAALREVGRTSMTVEVDVRGKKPQEGQNIECTTGEFVMVAVDDDHDPVPVPPIMTSLDRTARAYLNTKTQEVEYLSRDDYESIVSTSEEALL